MRQAYDYWQDQPGSCLTETVLRKPLSRCRPASVPSTEAEEFLGHFLCRELPSQLPRLRSEQLGRLLPRSSSEHPPSSNQRDESLAKNANAPVRRSYTPAGFVMAVERSFRRRSFRASKQTSVSKPKPSRMPTVLAMILHTRLAHRVLIQSIQHRSHQARSIMRPSHIRVNQHDLVEKACFCFETCQVRLLPTPASSH